MAKTSALDKELAELLVKAMQQPGVAEVMSIYQAARDATDGTGVQSPQPQWLYQVSDKSS